MRLRESTRRSPPSNQFASVAWSFPIHRELLGRTEFPQVGRAARGPMLEDSSVTSAICLSAIAEACSFNTSINGRQLQHMGALYFHRNCSAAAIFCLFLAMGAVL